MSGSAPVGGGIRPTVFFLSDYGLSDEFVGVVHAVLHRLVPRIAVVDLTHGVPPFNVRAGAAALERSVPHLGPGSVLAVVDPGVGGARRGVAVQGVDGRWFVGPDNGLLLPAVDRCGGVRWAVALDKPAGVPATFDGRDVFAPAAAALATGAGPEGLGSLLMGAELVRLPAPVAGIGPGPDGQRLARTEVVWVDRFGNVQLAVPATDGPPLERDGDPREAGVTVRIYGGGWSGGRGTTPSGGVAADPSGPPDLLAQLRVRRVPTFGALAAGEVGLLSDANGQLALAVREGSAAAVTGLAEGGLVELEW